jgi:multiple sugar transport system ATP-binding protein
MQRVAIGRALVREPNIYLMDEPLSSLDAKLRAELRLELKHIQRDLGATILYVTHDQTEAMTMADRIGILDAGRLVQIGTPREIYERPASLHVAARLGSAGDQPAAAGAPARRRGAGHGDRRGAHRASRAPARGGRQRADRLDRASRRPEPPAHRRGRAMRWPCR